MLDSAEISARCLLIWTGYGIGAVLLVFRAILDMPALASFGLALIIITSAYAVRGAVVAHDSALREAFELGRDHERCKQQQEIRALH